MIANGGVLPAVIFYGKKPKIIVGIREDLCVIINKEINHKRFSSLLLFCLINFQSPLLCVKTC